MSGFSRRFFTKCNGDTLVHVLAGSSYPLTDVNMCAVHLSGSNARTLVFGERTLMICKCVRVNFNCSTFGKIDLMLNFVTSNIARC